MSDDGTLQRKADAIMAARGVFYAPLLVRPWKYHSRRSPRKGGRGFRRWVRDFKYHGPRMVLYGPPHAPAGSGSAETYREIAEITGGSFDGRALSRGPLP